MTDLEKLLNEGREAAKNGNSISNNPYFHGTAAYWNWLAGFEEKFQKDSEEEFDSPWY